MGRSTLNDRPLPHTDPPPAGPSHTALATGGDELAEPSPDRWRIVKQNPARTVYFGRWNGQDVYLKHFHVRAALGRLARCLRGSDVHREVNTSGYLNSRGVATPEVVAWGSRGKVSWVATAAVASAEPADQWHVRQAALGQEGRAAIRRAAGAIAEMVARMHAAGVAHSDLHCGNILIRAVDGGLEPVLMDLHRVRRRRRLSRQARAANLAQLCYDRSPFTTRTERLRFLGQYMAGSGVSGSLKAWQGQVDDLARAHARRQYAQRDRRVLGRNRYFSTVGLEGGWRGHVVLGMKTPPDGSEAGAMRFTAAQWQQALARPEALFTGDVEVLKDSRSSQVVRRRLIVGGHSLDVFVKRSRRKYSRRLLIDCLRQSRAIRSFQLGHMLLHRRIATALPLAALERRVGPVLLDSILITEAVKAPDLSQFLNTYLASPGQASESLSVAQQRHAAQQVPWQIGRLMQRLHDHGLAHRDVKASNLLIRWTAGQDPRLVLLDLEGLNRWLLPIARRRFVGLMRLNVSLLACPAVNRAGRLRMLMGYLRRPGCGKVDFKPYWYALEDWSARKVRHQIRARRKRQKATRRPTP